jgi:Holliday junction resolvasome RuvABC endonuclease subunit
VSSYIGIDPGKSGGIALIDDEAARSVTFKLEKATERDVADWLGAVIARDVSGYSVLAAAVIEKVASTPQMGVCSAFTFGKSYGFLRGLLIGAGIPFVEVTPQKWQKAMGCMSKGDKNVTKAKAQQLYPNEKITHATADALLLATYCRQNHAQLF